jgi:hypothetical protein
MIQQTATNPEISQIIGPKRSFKVSFFVGDNRKLNVLVQQLEQVRQFGVGSAEMGWPPENRDVWAAGRH